MSGFDWSPLWISIKTAFAATLISFILGMLAARFVMYRKKERTVWVLDGLFTLPLVLPPTVTGFLLLIIFSPVRPFGKFLQDVFHIRLVQTWPACVIAAAVVSFPLMYRSARSAFEEVDINYIDAGRVLSYSEWQIFCRIVVPLAGPGIATGTVLTFVRALGEYGATVMFAGNILGRTRTVSTAIAAEVASNRYGSAAVWVVIILLISFSAVFCINLFAGHKVKTVSRWSVR